MKDTEEITETESIATNSSYLASVDNDTVEANENIIKPAETAEDEISELFPDSDDDKYVGEWQVAGNKKKKAVLTTRENIEKKEEIEKGFEKGIEKGEEDNGTNIIDGLTELIQDQNVVCIDSYKAFRSLKYLRHQWRDLRFLKVKKVIGLGQCHIVINNKKENQQVYITDEEYDRMYEEAKKDNQHLNFAKSVTRTWEYGYYGWATFWDCDDYDEEKYDSVYFHYTNYAQMDFGLATGRNMTDGINTKFGLTQYAECKTPQRGDFLCGIVTQSSKYKNKLELSPFFVNSETFYRTFMCVMKGQKFKIFKGQKSEAKLTASMICNGNDVLRKDYKKVMTPFNCEDIAINEHFVYMTIVMVLILNRRFKFPNLFTTVSPVQNLEYWEFILNIGDANELNYLNNSSALCPKFEKINLRHFTSNLNNHQKTRQCAWGECTDYDEADRRYPPMERGRQTMDISGSRYKYDRSPYRYNRGVHESFYEENRYDYGMTDSTRAYDTRQSSLYYQGYASSRRKARDRWSPYRKDDNGRQYDEKELDDYEIDTTNLDSRKWADMTPPPSPTSCHKIHIDSVYENAEI